MARQRIHNSRSGTGAGNAGASWISYSDLMAALLLVFVLILSVSLYQYFTMLETTQKELEAQQAQLDAQQIILLDQQSQLDSQTMQLAAQQVTMDNQSAMIIIMQGEIAGKQAELDDKEADLLLSQQELAASQEELRQAYIILAQQEADLNSQQIALDNANVLLATQQKELEDQKLAFRTQTKMLGSMVGVKTEIIQEVTSALNSRRINANVDPASGDIRVDSTQLRFQTSSSTLTPDGKAFLDSFIPVYLEVLLRPEYSNYIGSIIIEGHTDDTGSYLNNLKLSQNRALEVATYILNMYPEGSAQRKKLEQILTATGRSESDLIYTRYGSVDQDASRRVEFKFSLQDAEMIEEINRILNSP